MSKAKLIFDLNDYDDKRAFERANKSTDMAMILFEIQFNLIKEIEYQIDGDKLKDPYEVTEYIRKRIAELCEEHGVNVDSLLN